MLYGIYMHCYMDGGSKYFGGPNISWQNPNLSKPKLCPRNLLLHTAVHSNNLIIVISSYRVLWAKCHTFCIVYFLSFTFSSRTNLFFVSNPLSPSPPLFLAQVKLVEMEEAQQTQRLVKEAQQSENLVDGLSNSSSPSPPETAALLPL